MTISANDNVRTPTEHRAVIDAWRETAPANDGEIWPRAAEADAPRHAALAPQLEPLRFWRALRELAEQSGGGTTWMAGPSEAEPGVPAEWTAEALIMAASIGVRWRRLGGRLIPADGDLERSETTGRIVRCGRLVLADDLRADNDNIDDEQDEDEPRDLVDVIEGRTMRCDPSYNRTVPAGTILAVVHMTRDGRTVRLKPPQKPRFRERLSPMPPANVLPGIHAELEARDLLARLVELLDPQHILILDTAPRAQSFRQVGEALGKSGKTAERAGKRAVLAACDQLRAALNRIETRHAA